jgi:hypothetical protein
VVRFYDYTAKYGLGFLLSDLSAGVCFNDGSKVVCSADGVTFQYIERVGQSSSVQGQRSSRDRDKDRDRDRERDRSKEHHQYYRQTHLLSAFPVQLQKKVTLLTHFRSCLLRQYKQQQQQLQLHHQQQGEGASEAGGAEGTQMDLTRHKAAEGATSTVRFGRSSASYFHSDKAAAEAAAAASAERQKLDEGSAVDSGDCPMDSALPFVKKWVRTTHATLFRLSNRTVQVCSPHTWIRMPQHLTETGVRSKFHYSILHVMSSHSNLCHLASSIRQTLTLLTLPSPSPRS